MSVGACPRLQHISLNVGISDYFKDVKNRTNIGQFKEHMDQLRVRMLTRFCLTVMSESQMLVLHTL